MKASALILSIAAFGAATVQGLKYENEFMSFMEKFEKNYESEEEMFMRFGLFVTNMEKAIERNLEAGEEVHGVTKFSDLSPEEFKQFLNYQPMDAQRRSVALNATVAEPRSAAPTSYDWRSHGGVTAVKDQGQCGSCWAFSATEQIESQWHLQGGHSLTEFAPQQIVSCDKTDGGCNGGDTITAYQYVESAGGLAASSAYPYTSGRRGVTGKCKSFTPVGGHVSGYSYATPGCTGGCKKQNEAKLAANLASTAPVSICVDAEPWQTYTKGVLPASQCQSAYNDLDHCVQLVGFDTSGSNPYWIVRNSWNTDWGLDGYIHLEYGKNTCGVADEATFVKF